MVCDYHFSIVDIPEAPLLINMRQYKKRNNDPRFISFIFATVDLYKPRVTHHILTSTL